MSKCRKCQKEINDLTYNSKVEVSQTFDVSEEDNGEIKHNYGVMDDFGDHYDDEYCCPLCFVVLFRKEEDATNFLLGKKIKKDKTKNK